MSSRSTTKGVRDFFRAEAKRFDSIYTGPSSPTERLVDLLFHRVIRRRFERTLELLDPVEGRRILDVGCGPGRYTVELAARGAARAVGVDFAGEMLELARAAAAARRVGDRCDFVAGDFLEVDLPGPFDACVAIGLLEYAEDPLACLRRMAAVTRGDLVASFPKRLTLRTLPRAIRYRLRGCFLRFFTAGEVRRLAAAAGLEAVQVYSVSRDYLLHGRSSGGPEVAGRSNGRAASSRSRAVTASPATRP